MSSRAFPSPESGSIPQQSLPSPSPTDLSTINSSLPHPRSHPLRPGSSKEDKVRRYIEERLLLVSRRYTKKFQPPQPGGGAQGYHSMGEVCKDFDEIVDVIWLSGTPSLQIPYLMNIALAVSTYLSAFPPEPQPTFAFLRKLDHAFASLLKGADIETGETLPGFEAGKGAGLKGAGLSKTDMVRCKSLVEATRVQIMDIMNPEMKPYGQLQPGTGSENDTDTDVDGLDHDNERDNDDYNDENYSMDIARVYEETVVQLGDELPTIATN